MSKWINKFLRKESSPLLTTDNTDRFNSTPNMSVLSVPTQGILDRNVENMGLPSTDNTDRFNPTANMSVLSVPLHGLIDSTSFTFYDTELLDEYEERLAIAEYDGLQPPVQAERIAYLDAFLSILATLPYEDTEGDWLSHKIKAAKAWLQDQGISFPK